MADYTFPELTEEAGKRNINLGKNPVRTIRYYVDMKLLPRPSIKQVGKRRLSFFDSSSLTRLRLIDHYKKEGVSLSNIKNKMSETVYWSEDVYSFISKYEDIIPKSILPEFAKGSPVTREQFAFFLLRFLEEVQKGYLQTEDLMNFFIDKDGNKAFGIALI